MAKTPRTWTGARTPSGLKRVRNARRRHEVLQPRRTAAKTYVAKALTAATNPSDGIDPQQALAEALSALDHAAKAGAIHPNAAARRKSRLTIKINAAVGGAPCRARRPGREDDRQGRGPEGREGTHRRVEGRQGQGRADGRRQGPGRAEPDRPRHLGRVGDGGCPGDGSAEEGDNDAVQGRCPEEDDRDGRPRRRRPRRPRRRPRRASPLPPALEARLSEDGRASCYPGRITALGPASCQIRAVLVFGDLRTRCRRVRPAVSGGIRVLMRG